jgi:glycosyltransferase involved in cell wall biosynthesis
MTGAGSGFGVCILTETFHPVTGGGETQARTLAEGLHAAGIRVHLITRRSDKSLPAREVVGGVPVYRLAPAGAGQFRKWGMVLTAFGELLRLRRHYDVILVCGFRILGVPALLAKLLLGRPCILKADSQGELSGRFFDPGLERLKLRHDRFPVRPAIRMRNFLLRGAARFVAISAIVEQEYSDHGIPSERIVRIPNSVNPSTFKRVLREQKNELRASLGIPPGRKAAIFTGRLVTTKGLPSLLRAWPAVIVRHPDALLMLVGSGGLGLQNCETELKRRVAQQGLEGSVRFTGSVGNVHEYLQAGDIFVFPSEREAFGISVIEAMACGLPIVTTCIDGIKDIVRPGVDALVVPPGDDGALAAAMMQALDGGDDIAALAAAARQRVLQRYSDGRVVAAYRDLLTEVLPR